MVTAKNQRFVVVMRGPERRGIVVALCARDHGIHGLLGGLALSGRVAAL